MGRLGLMRVSCGSGARCDETHLRAACSGVPSPLAGEGGEIERSEIEPGEGSFSLDGPLPLTRPRRFAARAPSPTRGEGTAECCYMTALSALILRDIRI